MRRGIAVAVALLGLVVLAPPASAVFHLMKIREVRTGGATPFVELQMYSPGQTQLEGHSLTIWQNSGVSTATVPLNDVAMGDNQRSVLIAPGAVDGVSPDITGSLPFNMSGGAVCFDSIDCVAYGGFIRARGSGLPSPVGTPVPGYPAADASLSITRSIAAGCSTLLEGPDDTNDSAADFTIGPATPRNNSTAPTETACDGGGGGGGDNDPPQTKIKKGPKGKVDETTVKFKFKSSEPNSTFECKVDRKKFKPCKSPKKVKRLDEDKHKFLVRATDAAGNTDPSPAKRKFEVVD